MNSGNTAAIILAAGLSSRMGEFKPLLHLGDRSLIELCADTLRQAGIKDIILVTGHNKEQLTYHAKQAGLRTIYNPDYHSGMFSSVQAGVRQLTPEASAFFILPVDIPLVRPTTILTLLQQFIESSDEALVPCFSGQQGHPPLISNTLIPLILDYTGQGGLQGLLAQSPTREIGVWDRFILRDADTREDYQQFQKVYAQRNIPVKEETVVLLQILVPEKRQAHGLLVGKVAETLGDELNKSDHDLALNLDLLYAGGCLHDLAKGEAEHGLVAAEKLRSLGLAEVAVTVARHSSLPINVDEQLAERHLVCLADKAVSGDRLIEPRVRYEQKLAQFRNDPEACLVIRQRMQEGLHLQQRVEKELGRPMLALLHERIE